LKKLSILALGIIIGITLSISFSASADTVKQYILTKIGYPIIVNGQEYSDAKFPALNYNGTTYLPLKGVGDVLGTAVKWNDQLKRVEVGKEPQPTPTATPQTLQIKPLFATTYIYKVDGKTYTPYMQSIFMLKGNDNKYYLSTSSLDSLVMIMQVQNKAYKVTTSTNPYTDGIITPNPAENAIESKELFLSVSQRYFETTIYNPSDRSKFYFMSTQPGKETGYINNSNAQYLPAEDVFSSLGINIKIDWDEEQRVLTLTF
jgi:hypothetical protein